MAAATNYDSRPIVLNRPFQSVAELGYVSRDDPWRSLDFFNPQSGDAALLDVFCVYGPDPWSYAPENPINKSNSLSMLNETGLIAGRVNLNTRQAPVLAALLKGSSPFAIGTFATNTNMAALTDAQATNVAQGLTAWTAIGPNSNYVTQGPLRNPAELVGKFVRGTSYSGFSSQLTTYLADSSSTTHPEYIKQQRECVMRALADAGTTRTWNLLIDLVAQTGQFAPGASGAQNFIVRGDKHIWVSVAIDRVTGKVIKMQVEPVRS